MTKELKCDDLKVKDCDFTVRGESAREVIEQAVEHLRQDHDMMLPDAQTILDGKNLESLREEVRLVVARMRETLDILGKPETPETGPVTGTPPPPDIEPDSSK